MTILLHITGLANAIAIVKSGVYLTSGADDTGSDSCLNSFVLGREKCLGQDFESAGAVVRFEWLGPMRINNDFPLEPDVLHLDLPWRAMVPTGTTRHLRITGLRANFTHWVDEVRNPPWYCLTDTSKSRFRNEQAMVLKKDTAARIKTRPSIEVRLGR